MKRLLWFGRNKTPVIEIVLDIESAQWVLDRLDRDDRSYTELREAVNAVLFREQVNAVAYECAKQSAVVRRYGELCNCADASAGNCPVHP